MTTEKVGAPTKFTEETKGKLIYAVGLGCPYELACDYAGITYSCLLQWQTYAKHKQIPEFVEFFGKLKEAKGAATLHWLEKVNAAMTESWQAAAWKLERRRHKYFSLNAPLIAMEERLRKIEEREKEIRNARSEAEEMDPESD